MIQQQKMDLAVKEGTGQNSDATKTHMLIDFGHFLCINHPFLGSPILIHACMATGEG
jgi:protein-S-isoprenylcysteine O-methyltransferase Ste14